MVNVRRFDQVSDVQNNCIDDQVGVNNTKPLIFEGLYTGLNMEKRKKYYQVDQEACGDWEELGSHDQESSGNQANSYPETISVFIWGIDSIKEWLGSFADFVDKGRERKGDCDGNKIAKQQEYSNDA